MPSPTLSQRRDGGRQSVRGPVVKRPIQVAKHAQSILVWRFWNQSGDVALIAYEHNLFLVALERVENSTEVACHVSDGACFHTIRLSD